MYLTKRRTEMRRKTTYIIIAQFWTTRYMDDARYCVGDRTPVEDRILRPHQDNEVFEQMSCPNSPLVYASQIIMTLKGSGSIFIHEEFNADYSENYTFQPAHVKTFIIFNYL